MARPFPCPSCGQFLEVSLSYYGWVYAFSILAAFMIAYAFGIRSWLLLLATSLGWLPIYCVARIAINLLAYPQVKLSFPDDLSFHLKDPPA